MLRSNKDKGFTIIEVVLVLAIAGLIFLTVFLALPALQKSQRDNARRQDVGNVVAALQSYLADNNSLPATTSGTVFASYYGGTASLAQADTVTITTATATAASNSTMIIVNGYDCSNTAGARKAAVKILLESGTTYCKAV